MTTFAATAPSIPLWIAMVWMCLSLAIAVQVARKAPQRQSPPRRPVASHQPLSSGLLGEVALLGAALPRIHLRRPQSVS